MSDAQPTVEYREVPGFPGYRVGADGSVWSRWKQVSYGWRYGLTYVLGDKWKRLKLGRHRLGYATVVLMPGRKNRSVHRLVLAAFVGPCPPGMQGCHNDGNPANNNLPNLRWDTPKANQHDRKRHGTNLNGSNVANSKLTDDIVRQIHAEYATGMFSQMALARKHHITQTTVWRILHKKCWVHVT